MCKNSVSLGQSVLLLIQEPLETTEVTYLGGTVSRHKTFVSCTSESPSIAEVPLTLDTHVMYAKNESVGLSNWG